MVTILLQYLNKQIKEKIQGLQIFDRNSHIVQALRTINFMNGFRSLKTLWPIVWKLLESKKSENDDEYYELSEDYTTDESSDEAADESSGEDGSHLHRQGAVINGA